jgi:hypothetical protein
VECQEPAMHLERDYTSADYDFLVFCNFNRMLRKIAMASCEAQYD